VAWYVGTPALPILGQGWLEIGGWRDPIPPQIYRLAITLNGPTALAAYLALLIPPAITLVIGLPARNQNRQALVLWLVLAFSVVFLTSSRAGVLALGTSLPLTMLGWYLVTGQSEQAWSNPWRRLKPAVRVVLIAGAVVILGGGLLWLQRSLVARASSTDFRLMLWRAAFTVFQDHLLTGAGPANFGRALLQLNDASLPRLQISSAHSVYFNTAAELGLVGLLAGVYLYGATAWAWYRRWRQAQVSRLERLSLVGCGAALAGLAVQTLVDTYSATPNILVAVALLAYLAAGLPPAARPTRRPATGYLALAGLLLYAVGLFWLARADARFQTSFAEEARGDLRAAIAQAEQSQQLDPALTLRTFRLALLEARLAHQTGDSGLAAAAIDHYQAGLAREPILGLNSANLAGLLWQQARPAEAIELMQRTVAAEADPLYLVNLGYFYEQLGEWAEAGAAYGRALALAPALAGSGFWQADAERAARWPEIAAAAAGSTGDSALARQTVELELALAREEFGVVEKIVGPITAETAARSGYGLAEVYLHRAQPEQAAALLDPMPRTGPEYLLWGRIKLQQGDDLAAEKLLKTAAFLGTGQAHYYLGQLYEQQGRLPAAEQAYQRGFSSRATSENVEVTIYGRRAGNDMAPQLLRIGVSPAAAAPWLALARLHETQGEPDQARYIYEFLLAEDPFLSIAQERLARLEDAAGSQ
jgi:tetratricopeptide (TPR) repeat protein